MRKNNQGFTLIELLVVISIISVLSSMAIVSLNGARMKARDALRKADMSQLRTALALYYDDHNQYPVCSSTWNPSNPPYFGATNNCYNTVLTSNISGGTHPILSPMPKDPLNPMNDDTVSLNYLYRYVSSSQGREYLLIYYLEDGGIRYIHGW